MSTTFDEATIIRAKTVLQRLRVESAARSSDDPVRQTQRAVYWLSRDGLFRQLACRIVQAIQNQAGTNGGPTTKEDALSAFSNDVLQNAKTETQRIEFTHWLNARHKFLSTIAGRLWFFANELEPAAHRVVPVDEPSNQPKPDSRIMFIHVGDKPPTRPAVEHPPQPQEESVLRYSLQIRGRWGRKRTDDFLSVDLAKRVDPKAPWALTTLQLMMFNKVRELAVQPGARLKLVESPMTISSDGTERFLLGSDRTLHEEVLT